MAWERVREQIHKRDQSLMFAANRLKICPKVLMSDWAGYVMKARSWYDTGQLGISFITAPAWVSHAFAILDNQTSAALDFKRENKPKRSK